MSSDLGEGISDGVADALSERAGRRFDSVSFSKLGVTGGDAVELAEIFDLLERKVVARNVEPAIEKHRAMTRGEDKTVAVEPFWSGGVVAHRVSVENGTDIGSTERESEVAGAAGVDSVNGEAARFIRGGGEGF